MRSNLNPCSGSRETKPSSPRDWQPREGSTDTLRPFTTRYCPRSHRWQSGEVVAEGGNPEESAEAAQRLFAQASYRSAFIEYFGRESMARNGRDPEQFRHVDGDIGVAFLERLEQHLRRVPPSGNPYFWRYQTGSDGSGKFRFVVLYLSGDSIFATVSTGCDCCAATSLRQFTRLQ